MHTKNEVKILVDWITFTVGFEELISEGVDPEEQDTTVRGILERIRAVFSLGDIDFTDRGGLNGYTMGWTNDNEINVCWGGNNNTVMVQFTGKGCRLYETLRGVDAFDWLEFIRMVLQFRTHNVSRLDIACDTFGSLDIDKIMTYTAQERVVKRFQDYVIKYGNKIRQVDFGSRKSLIYLRIYDKTLERKREVEDDVEVPENWIRLEFEFSDDAADSFIGAWMQTRNISTAYFGIMANQLRFVKERAENASRSETAPWWARFLSNADKIALAYKGGLEYNLQSLQKYVFGQAGSSIRAWLELPGNDTEKLVAMVKHRKLNERQQRLLDLKVAEASQK